ncbi:MAG: ABC transporter permease subunit [Desulfohalobiaceae bacterium]|nr:ABC transporter permease subunit [Desulfohalobiaceae bacterium]
MIDLYGFGDLLLAGTWMTIRLILSILCFGLVLGMIGAGAKLSRFRILNLAAEAFTSIVRGIPELILILGIYFGGTVAINNLLSGLGYEGYLEINPFAAGVVALGTAYGAYATDVFRVSIQSIHKGQIEAARAMGMRGTLIFRRIVLPQIWVVALPALGNLFLVSQKDSALVSVIGLQEIMRASAFAVRYTKKPFTFYLAAAFIYLGLAVVTTVGIQYFEKKAGRGLRRD